MIRLMWIAAGWTAVGLGLLGAVLPLLPTVPFMLLAAFCFARGSERAHRWLTTHPRFGPAIRDWQAHGAISRNGKRWAMIAIFTSFTISFMLDVRASVLLVQAIALGGVLTFVLTRPDAPAPTLAGGAAPPQRPRPDMAREGEMLGRNG